MNTVKWNARIQFPTSTDFQNRIIGASFGPSNSSGNPMLTIESEVVSPETMEVGEQNVIVSGVKSKNYYVTQVLMDDGKTVDEEKTAKARKNVTDLYTLLGLDPATINWDNIDTKPLLGIVYLSMMSPDEEPMRKNPTSAQLAEAKRLNKRPEGDIMRNPVTGKPLINYWPKVREIFGVAANSGGVGVPY